MKRRKLKVIKPSEGIKDGLKELVDSSKTPEAKALQACWDKNFNDTETLGDVLTNALEYSLNVRYEKSIVRDGKHHRLLVGPKESKCFNMKELTPIFDKVALWRFKPKNVSKLDFLYMVAYHPSFVRILSKKSNDMKLVVRLLNPPPIIPPDEDEVTVNVSDVLDNDIFIFDVDDTDEYDGDK